MKNWREFRHNCARTLTCSNFAGTSMPKSKDGMPALTSPGLSLKVDPTRPDAWIHRSFALHELKRTQEAFDELLSGADRFPKVWTIPYDLACYCAQLERLEECKEWFTKA